MEPVASTGNVFFRIGFRTAGMSSIQRYVTAGTTHGRPDLLNVELCMAIKAPAAGVSYTA